MNTTTIGSQASPHMRASSWKGSYGIVVPFILARTVLAPLELKTALAKEACKLPSSPPEAWEEVAALLDAQCKGEQARMFRAAATSMRNEGKRYKLVYPDNQEHIVEAYA